MTFLLLIEQYSGNAKLKKKLEWNGRRKPVNQNVNNEYLIQSCLAPLQTKTSCFTKLAARLGYRFCFFFFSHFWKGFFTSF